MLRGHELLRHGHLTEAQEVLQRALAADQGNPRIMALLGLTHFRAGAFEPARTIYEQLTARSPADASHQLNLGLVHLKLGDAARAVDALEKSRALDPSQARTVRYLGLAYARAGRFGHAYRAFLLAGQPELANEVAQHIAAADREAIHVELVRSGIPTANRDVGSSDVSAAATGGIVVSADRSAALSRSSASGSRSRISAALRIATPSTAGSIDVPHEAGARPPIALSQFATESLIRPDDASEAFEIAGHGALVIRVFDRLFTRLDGVHVTSGALAFEPTMRRRHGRQTTDRFGCSGASLQAVSGKGYLIAVPGKRSFTALALDDDVLYLREDLVFAFEAALRWENGNIPGLHTSLPFVQFRGHGAVALLCERPLVRVKLPAEAVIAVSAANLAGWIGRVIPRAVRSTTPAAAIECSGEGVILVDPVATADIATGR